MNSSSLKAGSDFLSSTGARAESKKPIPLPSALRWLCTSSESGASSSQNVVRTGVRPEFSPNRRHMALLLHPGQFATAREQFTPPHRPASTRIARSVPDGTPFQTDSEEEVFVLSVACVMLNVPR